jgi:flagellar assembly protein FliH
MSAQQPVLRNVTVSERPHALVRPGSQPAPEPAEPVQAPEPAAPPVVDIQAELDEAFRRGREQGRQEGLREAFDAARSEALAAAREQGRAEGREAGLRTAQEEARAAVKQALEALERLLTALPQRFDMRMAAQEEDMLALCFETVARVLGQEAASHDGLRHMLRQTLAAFGPRRLAEIRLHPGDVQCLADDPAVAAWLHEREGGEGIQIVADPAIELGGIVLRSPSGRLDARLEHQVDALRTALLAVRASRAGAAAAQRPARPAGAPAGARA